MLPYITYFQIFSSIFTCVVLTFFPNVITYKQMAILIAIASAIVLVPKVFKQKGVSLGTIMTCFLCLMIVVLYYLTSGLYGRLSNIYNSFMLVLCGQMVPIVLCSTFVAQSKEIQLKIKRLSPIVACLFSIIAFLAAFSPTSATSGGYMMNDNGLSYQNTSYMAAYAAAFCLYYILCYNEIEWNKYINNRICLILMIALVFINFLTILIAGGRGGFALFITQISFAVYIYIKRRGRNSLQQVMKYLLLTILITGIVLLIVNYVENSTIKTNGYERILATIKKGDSNGRNILRDKAIECFQNKPILGHGFGSVFYEMGIYSHNCITDALLEIGVVGCGIYIFFLIYACKEGFKMLKNDFTDYIWLVIFLDGFVMSLFSGYYITQIPTFWAATFLLNAKSQRKMEDNNETDYNSIKHYPEM